MAWTVPADVTDSWIGPDAPTDDALIEVWIGKAEREIRVRVPDIRERLESDTSGDLRATVVDVVVAMVSRVFRNPEGIRQRNTTETVGPFSGTGSVTYGGSVPGGLAITDDELASLQGAQTGAFTIDLFPSTSPYYTEA